jgi:hypothetical protein
VSEFDSAWWKWHWAGVHAHELKECFPGGAHAQPFIDATIESEYDPKRHCIVLRVTTASPPPAEWALRLGDVVGNYRAALDHLAWTIVMRGVKGRTLTEAQESGVYFPICVSPSHFTKSIGRKLPGARRADLAVIRRYQPYQRGKRNLPIHVLTILNECSKLDKHRALQTTPTRPARSELRIGRTEDCEVTEPVGMTRIRTTAIQPNAEVGRIRVRKTGPNPRAYVNARFGLEVAIEHKVWLRSWLNETQTFVGALLAEFGNPPRGVRYVV